MSVLNWFCIPESIKNKLRPMPIALVYNDYTFMEFNDYFPYNTWSNQYNYHYLANFFINHPNLDLFLSVDDRYYVSIKGLVLDSFTKKILQLIISNGSQFYYINNKYIYASKLITKTFFPELTKYRIIHMDGDKYNQSLFNFKYVGLKMNEIPVFHVISLPNR